MSNGKYTTSKTTRITRSGNNSRHGGASHGEVTLAMDYHGKPRKILPPQGHHGEVKIIRPADPEKLRAYRESVSNKTTHKLVEGPF